MAKIKNKLKAKKKNSDLYQKLIKEQIKRVSVFGTFEKQGLEFAEKWKKLGKKLAELGLIVVVGGDSGAIKMYHLALLKTREK